MTARPDPLAPLPERPRPGGTVPPMACGVNRSGERCGSPAVVVWWLACPEGEHAGPFAWCESCAPRSPAERVIHCNLHCTPEPNHHHPVMTVLAVARVGDPMPVFGVIT